MGPDFDIQLLAQLSSVGVSCRCLRTVAGCGARLPQALVRLGGSATGLWFSLCGCLLARWAAAVSLGDPCLAGRVRRLDRLSRRLAGSGL